MFKYIGRRLLQAIPLLVGVSILAFAMMHLAPGGPLAVYTLNPTITAQDIERIKTVFGLDQPIYIQYAKWAWGMFTGDWGNTFFGGRPVFTVIMERVPATFLLMGSGMAVAVLLGMFIGILGAFKRYSIFDYLATTGAMVALSFPTFWFGLMAIFIFSLKLGWLPSGGMYTLGGEEDILDLLRHMILPTMVLALVLVAQWSRYTRSSFLEVIHQDYIRTARSKGLSGKQNPLSACLPQCAGTADCPGGDSVALAVQRGAGYRNHLRVARDGTAFCGRLDDEGISGIDGNGDGDRYSGHPWQSSGGHHQCPA